MGFDENDFIAEESSSDLMMYVNVARVGAIISILILIGVLLLLFCRRYFKFMYTYFREK